MTNHYNPAMALYGAYAHDLTPVLTTFPSEYLTKYFSKSPNDAMEQTQDTRLWTVSEDTSKDEQFKKCFYCTGYKMTRAQQVTHLQAISFFNQEPIYLKFGYTVVTPDIGFGRIFQPSDEDRKCEIQMPEVIENSLDAYANLRSLYYLLADTFKNGAVLPHSQTYFEFCKYWKVKYTSENKG